MERNAVENRQPARARGVRILPPAFSTLNQSAVQESRSLVCGPLSRDEAVIILLSCAAPPASYGTTAEAEQDGGGRAHEQRPRRSASPHVPSIVEWSAIVGESVSFDSCIRVALGGGVDAYSG